MQAHQPPARVGPATPPSCSPVIACSLAIGATRPHLRSLTARGTDTPKRGHGRTVAGTPLDESRARKVFGRVLKQADLPLHVSPHGLRHTFGSLLLQQGESPVCIQPQFGHAWIQLTVDTYG